MEKNKYFFTLCKSICLTEFCLCSAQAKAPAGVRGSGGALPPKPQPSRTAQASPRQSALLRRSLGSPRCLGEATRAADCSFLLRQKRAVQRGASGFCKLSCSIGRKCTGCKQSYILMKKKHGQNTKKTFLFCISFSKFLC